MRSAAKPTTAPGMGPNSRPDSTIGTASREIRVVSAGMRVSTRASTTLSAVSRAQTVRA